MDGQSSGGPEWLDGQPPSNEATKNPLRCARVSRERIVTDRTQEPFRAPVLGIALYTLAVVAGGPAVVVAKRAAPAAEAPLRIGLAWLALAGILLLARERRGRPFVALAACAALLRALGTVELVDPGRLVGALLEGVEMAAVALALATHLSPTRVRSRVALIALAAGAFALKLAWALEQTTLVRYGGLALLPLALTALVAYLRGRSSSLSS